MILSAEELLQKTGYKRIGDLKRFLRNNRIPFIEGKGKPVTTLEAVQKVLDGRRTDGPNWTPYVPKNTKRPRETRVVVLQEKQ